MTSTYDVAPARSLADLSDVASLFGQYASSLPVDLSYQDFSAELSGLPGKYAPPEGELLIARDTLGRAVGCVGLRPLKIAGCCEMKRLFTLPSTRSHGLGHHLSQAVIFRARELGYTEIRLDTLPTMHAAIALYERIGFDRCPPYYTPTPAGTIFLAKKL